MIVFCQKNNFGEWDRDYVYGISKCFANTYYNQMLGMGLLETMRAAGANARSQFKDRCA
jgi:hypothetical protein